MVAYKALRALTNTEMALFAQDLDMRYLWLFNADNSWLASAANGLRDSDFLPASAAERCDAIKRTVLDSGKPARFELQIADAEQHRWFDVRVDVDRDDTGAVIGLVGTSLEITEQKRREDTLKSLLRELSHRSKNLLAIIQSLASQTARHSITVPEFLVRFRGRIQSLSASQDIVTDADWRGAGLSMLVASQVERYAPEGMRQVHMAGPEIYLSPTAALHVGLALHELAVNAASYGSLSVHGGIVDIRVDVAQEQDARHLTLHWQEMNGPHVGERSDTRFGTSTLERIVPNSVGGEAELSYQPEGLRYRLRIPDAHFEVIEQRKAV
ncbi:PAS domain-containing protein [Aureimonas altamirensis]|uniref:sensor histidine kinase n=1 Tax=Aureimonas altamirensis TaxID=370622 RepID=UPI0020374516|nr:PAS domain-containing sensor histidine kinase [Aureimonas altamirensis]MCM2503281.1 PAS domain-containing protein [Aureimonas altamirensis]